MKPGKNQFEKGKLAANRPVGVWEYIDYNGKTELTFDYDSSRIIYIRPDTTRYWLKVDTTWQLVRPMRAPRLLGSREHDLAQIGQSIRYPSAALRSGTEGTVLISYIVTPTGQAQDFLIENGLSPACDEEAWKALRDNFNVWIPAIYRGKPVPARFYLMVTFRMVGSEQRRKESDKEMEALTAGKNVHFVDHVVVTALGIERKSGTSPLPKP
ncbi:energy transducer TonB [Hymenobacter sp. BT730]|uniref:energy transducer TonB n=1 Tax=Hymenobacter sp. BT730 TaxID=3063332 RepID=UPI0026DFC7AE|nr:energy transducer TonB [Hymenobacter sp. BT730]